MFGTSPAFPDAGFVPCLAAAFHFPYGLYGLGLCIGALALLILMVMRMGYSEGGEYDRRRNLVYSNKGTYGTAGFMSRKELAGVLDLVPDIRKHSGIVTRTNVLRAERDIAALTADDQLMRAAQVRADEMAATGTYSHTRPDGRKYYTVTDCRQVGENIHQIPLLYLAQQKTALAETLIYSWSKSAGHMENMTDESYAAIGIGLARGTDANGLECWYCVQLFLRSGYSISAVDKPATK